MNPALIKQFLNSDLVQPLDQHITEKTDVLDAKITTVDTVVDATKVVVDSNATKINTLTTNLGTVDTVVDNILALMGAANPPSGDTTTAMNFLKLIYNQLGQDDPVSADRTTIMNYLKLLEELSGSGGEDIFGLYPWLVTSAHPDLTISVNTTASAAFHILDTFKVDTGVVYTAGGNGLTIIANEIVINGTLTASGKGMLGGAALVALGHGNVGIASTKIGGSGGGGGGYWNSKNGGAGGAALNLVGGTGGSASSVNSAGGPGNPVTDVTGLLSAVIAKHFANPSTLSDLFCGAGGGGGALGVAGTSGKGGAGGGYLILIAKKITIGASGLIAANGLQGDAPSAVTVGGAGGGGGGGVVALSADIIENNGTISVAGGAGRSVVDGGANHSGAAGGAGYVYIHNW